MEGGEGAPLRVRGEIILEPGVLSGRGGGVGRPVGEARVEHDDMPGADVQAVVAQIARPGAVTPIIPHAADMTVVVVVVPQGVVRPCLVPAPGRVVALEVVAGIREHGVAQRQHRSGDGIQDLRGELVASAAAGGDIAGHNQQRGIRRWGRLRRRGDGGRSGGRQALRALAVGDHQSHREGRCRGVHVRRRGAGAGRAVPEVPDVSDGVAVRVGRRAAVEADGVPGCPRIGPRRTSDRRSVG